MRPYRLTWSRMKEPESIVCIIIGFIAGIMIGHPGTGILIDVLVISVVSGVTNWWMGRYMSKKFPDGSATR